LRRRRRLGFPAAAEQGDGGMGRRELPHGRVASGRATAACGPSQGGPAGCAQWWQRGHGGTAALRRL